MQEVNLDVAEGSLRELIERLSSGREILITDQANRPLAKLVALGRSGWKRRPGNAEGKIRMALDFDEPIDDLAEYMR